jgi:hypothetical protein
VESLKPGGRSKSNQLIHRYFKVSSPLDQQAKTGLRGQFHRNPRRTKLISGGQTGVDRAALDVALALGLDVGGGCLQGWRAEDGMIPERDLRSSPLFSSGLGVCRTNALINVHTIQKVTILR